MSVSGSVHLHRRKTSTVFELINLPQFDFHHNFIHSPIIMSTAADAHSSSTISDHLVKDIVLWRRKKLSALVLLTATGTWIFMEVYGFNFVTVISWLAMSLVAYLFLWGNILKLLGKEPSWTSEWGISEQTTAEAANSVRGLIEVGVRRMFTVSVEKDLVVFSAIMTGLWLLSYVGSCLDFHTFIFAVTLLGMSIPVIHVKYGDQMNRYKDWLKAKCIRSYEMLEERFTSKMKNVVGEKKEKKTE